MSGPIPKEKLFSLTGIVVLMYPNGWCHMRKIKDFFKEVHHYRRHTDWLAVVCIDINSMVCICYDIKQHESISPASLL